MNPTQTVEARSGALRGGDSPESTPSERADVVQFGASERPASFGTVAEPDDDTPRWQFVRTAVSVPHYR